MTADDSRAQKTVDDLARWKLIGVVATAVIVLMVPLSLVIDPGGRGRARAQRLAQPSYVGRDRCAPCHQAATESWFGSDHDLAMAEATEETVLGDFSDAEFEHLGISSRFFRRDGGFFVQT